MSNKYILHDLCPEDERELLSGIDGWQVISANKAYARCKGCFGCWIKSPGMCVMHDGMELIGYKLSTSDEVLVLSKGLYGGFSVEIKRLLDRHISGALPFFTRRNGEMHHPTRYSDRPKWSACFYNAAEMTEQEIELAREIMAANAVNADAKEQFNVFFVDGINKIRELL